MAIPLNLIEHLVSAALNHHKPQQKINSALSKRVEREYKNLLRLQADKVQLAIKTELNSLDNFVLWLEARKIEVLKEESGEESATNATTGASVNIINKVFSLSHIAQQTVRVLISSSDTFQLIHTHL